MIQQQKTATKKRSQFAGIEEVKVFKKNVYLNQLPGTHVLEILSVKSEQNERTGIYFFAADLKVVESTNETCKAGDTVQVYADTSKFEGTLFMKLAKSFAAAAYKTDPASIDENDLLALVAEDQPGVGVKIKAIVAPDKYGPKNKSGKTSGTPKITKTGEQIYRVDLLPIADPAPGKAA